MHIHHMFSHPHSLHLHTHTLTHPHTPTPSHPHTLTPLHIQYNPELVIISCGFDAARGDPLGHYDITPSGYAHMTHLLTSLAEGKVVIALEVHMCGFSVASQLASA